MGKITVPVSISEHDQSIIKSIRVLAKDARITDEVFITFFLTILSNIDYRPSKKC